ncbi:hypothetical protein CEXT_815221 [Caerostris extrusa]|uniref:Uncharacterized protein n=1 Tax=Caerostris extrusa TaxID=172846 RepID=A0AAV4UF04_CAEEX|nr:hypothetical protein CEXT_815221 [Caerostris extrusa]
MENSLYPFYQCVLSSSIHFHHRYAATNLARPAQDLRPLCSYDMGRNVDLRSTEKMLAFAQADIPHPQMNTECSRIELNWTSTKSPVETVTSAYIMSTDMNMGQRDSR